MADQMKYTCAACGVRAIVLDGKVIRPCLHENAAVHAHLSATATGDCKVAQRGAT